MYKETCVNIHGKGARGFTGFMQEASRDKAIDDHKVIDEQRGTLS